MICRTCAAAAGAAQRTSIRPRATTTTTSLLARTASRTPQATSSRPYSVLTRITSHHSSRAGIRSLSAGTQSSSLVLSSFSSSRPAITGSSSSVPPTLLSASSQGVRCFSATSPVTGPRDTYFNVTHKKRKRKFGFLARLRSRTGRKILMRRRAKGKQNMSH